MLFSCEAEVVYVETDYNAALASVCKHRGQSFAIISFVYRKVHTICHNQVRTALATIL